MGKRLERLLQRSLVTGSVLFLACVQAGSAQAAFDEAMRCYRSGDYQSALVHLHSLLSTNPSQAIYHYYAALCYQGLGKLTDAEREYQCVETYATDSKIKANAKLGLEQLSKYRAAGGGASRLAAQPGRYASSATAASPVSQAKSAGAASAPYVRDCLFAPTFTLKDGRRVAAGKAWCARLRNGQIVLVSALHLLGPAGGLDTQVPAARVSAVVDEVDLTSITDGNSAGRATVALSKSGDVRDGDDCSGDVIFFRAPPAISASRAFQIAEQPAAVGQRCWFYTCLANESTPQSYPGTVVESSVQQMEVRLDRRVVTRATSGSPILDQTGNVIGMLSGHYEQSGDLICVPGCSIARRVISDMSR